jgi:hypothetical protein
MIRTLAFVTLVTSIALSAPAFAKEPPCYCRDGQGNQALPGEMRCFTIGSRTFTAMCDWSLNTLTWREQHEGCVSS